MKKLALLLFLPLAGCAGVQSAQQQGEKITDDALKISLDALCDGTTMGAARRMYGSPDKLEAACKSLMPGGEELK